MNMRDALDALPPARPRGRWLRPAPRPRRAPAPALAAALAQPVLVRRVPSLPAVRRAGCPSLGSVLAPASVERVARGLLRAGDSWLITLEARVWPAQLQLGWLHELIGNLQLPGVTVHQAILPVPDTLARRWLAGSENAARGTLQGDAQQGVAEDVDAALGLAAAATLRAEVAAGTDRLFAYTLSVTVSGATRAEVQARVKTIRLAAAGIGLALEVAHDLQWEGYGASLPLGSADLLAHDWSGRALAQGLPARSSGLQLPPGCRPISWGVHPRTAAPVLWDRWTATNPHALVVAPSGSGKTYAVAGQLAQELALGEDALLILDPKHHEYRALVLALGGAYLSLSRGATLHINPLELPRLSAERQRALAELEVDLLGERISFVRSLVVGALRANHSRVDAGDVALLERAISAAYAARGIGLDPASFAQSMPVFSDVQGELRTLAKTGEDAAERTRARELARAMALFTGGTLGALFNAPSNIPTDNPLLALDLHALLNGEDALLHSVVPLVVADFFKTTALNRPTGRRYHLVLDEAHALLQSSAGARMIEQVFRVGRALGFAATVITQGLGELDASVATRTLLENAPTKLLLGQNRDSGAIERAAAVLQLNAAEQRYLAQCRRVPGTGALALLLADGERVPLLIPPWPPALHAMITGTSTAEVQP